MNVKYFSVNSLLISNIISLIFICILITRFNGPQLFNLSGETFGEGTELRIIPQAINVNEGQMTSQEANTKESKEKKKNITQKYDFLKKHPHEPYFPEEPPSRTVCYFIPTK